MRDRNVEAWEIKINQVVKVFKTLSAACDKAHAAGCLEPEGNLDKVIWTSFESLVDTVDCGGWISWFIWDNQCGKKKLPAAVNSSELKPIRTVKDLAKLIAKYE